MEPTNYRYIKMCDKYSIIFYNFYKQPTLEFSCNQCGGLMTIANMEGSAGILNLTCTKCHCAINIPKSEFNNAVDIYTAAIEHDNAGSGTPDLDVYCNASQCDKKTTCKYHAGIIHKKVYTMRDYSVKQSSACMDTTMVKVEIPECGDQGSYLKYEPALYLPKVSISTLKKEPYENWNHYNYERYNGCPKCDFNLTMTGQVCETQCFKCFKCNTEFILNVFTEILTLR